ncbi:MULTISPECIES: hypothetical protein [unclassified Duganella]|uniref:hypothetical protein n=1 Tax=unclassified Duganella TaxID=2636909 RepID=UPI0011C12626|nr:MULTISPECIES: hypothetical protein [unclassified Duganella]
MVLDFRTKGSNDIGKRITMTATRSVCNTVLHTEINLGGVNRIVIYDGVIGYFCQCGNAEVINHENYYYRNFKALVNRKGKNGTPLITCLKCHCPAHEPKVSHRLEDLLYVQRKLI